VNWRSRAKFVILKSIVNDGPRPVGGPFFVVARWDQKAGSVESNASLSLPENRKEVAIALGTR
jgi:hypothetical protein